jgi:spore maturation protein SpmA
MLNIIFLTISILSIVLATFTGQMEAITQAVINSAKDAVELALGLVGVMAFFLGLMKVAEEGGLLRILAKLLRPLLRRLFPAVPSDHPAIGAMIMNIAANLMGLGNAATPFGIKAMMELDRLNTAKGTATNAMILFLAINTSGLTLLPTTMISLRASAQSHDVAGILFPIWVAGGCATLMAVVFSPLLARLPWYRATEPPPLQDRGFEVRDLAENPAGNSPRISPSLRGRLWIGLMAISAFALGLTLFVIQAMRRLSFLDLFHQLVSFWILPAILLVVLLFGWVRGVKIYDAIIEGAKEGFNVALRIIPYLVAILVMAGLFRASGGLGMLVKMLTPAIQLLGMPAETLPVALLRPFSGSGTLGVVAELFKAHGADSLIGYMASIIYGSTETTFYVIAVYFGAIGIKNTRHAIPACLLADFSGILAGVLMVHIFWGNI